jgi:hypothetical protein
VRPLKLEMTPVRTKNGIASVLMADQLQDDPGQKPRSVSRFVNVYCFQSKYIALAWTNSLFGPHDGHGSYPM